MHASFCIYSGFMRGCRSFPSLSSMRLGTIASSLGSTADRDLCLSACKPTNGSRSSEGDPPLLLRAVCTGQ